MQSHFMYPAQERALLERIVKTPGFTETTRLPLLAWQHVALLCLTYGWLIGAGAGFLYGYVPYWLFLPVAVFVVYASFTPLHDATHRSVSRSPFVNDLVGTISEQALIPGATVALYRFLHLEHHRHTGDPERDPDEIMVSSPWWKKPLVMMFIDLVWFRWILLNWHLLTPRAKVRDVTSFAILLVWNIGWLLSPYATEFLLVFFIPQRLGIMTVAYLFAAIQHPEGVEQADHPLQATYMMKGGRLTRILMLGQAQHLMHHMFPMVPYYKYNAMWRLAKPTLADTPLVWGEIFGERPAPTLRPEAIAVSISRIEHITPLVRAFTLQAVDGSGPLPSYKAGAHIDVEMSDGLSRQYSLIPCATNTSATNTHRIAVKREDEGRGGSLRMHQLQEGDRLNISSPRNIFALAAETKSAVLVAGGIGITPLLSMAEQLHADGVSFEFHISAPNAQTAPFFEALQMSDYADAVVPHFSQDGQRFQAADLPAWQPGMHLYLCGGNAFMEAVVSYSKAAGWPDDHIHLEQFSGTTINDAQNEPFTVTLAKSGKTVEVPADRTLLEVLQENQVAIQASCMQGICATCKCRVLEGEITHHDVVLTDAEKQNGIMTACVSRAKNSHLRLDM